MPFGHSFGTVEEQGRSLSWCRSRAPLAAQKIDTLSRLWRADSVEADPGASGEFQRRKFVDVPRMSNPVHSSTHEGSNGAQTGTKRYSVGDATMQNKIALTV